MEGGEELSKQASLSRVQQERVQPVQKIEVQNKGTSSVQLGPPNTGALLSSLRHRNETNKRQMSFTTSQTGRSMKSAPWTPWTQRSVATSQTSCIADQLLAKVDVIRAMRERVQVCQDPQTEFVFLREGPGVSRINHIFRVHGQTILKKKRPPKTLMRLDTGHSEGSFQDSQSTVRSKPRSARVSQELVARSQLMLAAQRTWELWLRPSRGLVT